MRNLFALLFVACLFTFASCDKKPAEEATESTEMAAPDSSTMTPEAPAENMDEMAAPDSSAVSADSNTVAPADSAY